MGVGERGRGEERRREEKGRGEERRGEERRGEERRGEERRGEERRGEEKETHVDVPQGHQDKQKSAYLTCHILSPHFVVMEKICERRKLPRLFLHLKTLKGYILCLGGDNLPKPVPTYACGRRKFILLKDLDL